MAPLVRRSWSPRGLTPVLRQRGRCHQKVSVVAALCVSPGRDQLRFYFRLHRDANIRSPEIIVFLRALGRQLDGPVMLVWDRLNVHRSIMVQNFLETEFNGAAWLLPPYAPELNPVEPAWSYLKMNPLANLAVRQVELLAAIAHRHSRALQHRQPLLRSFLAHSPLFLRLQ
jgi:transposase